jgi:2-iminobutanoate/2-iminopropanoate deaminase
MIKRYNPPEISVPAHYTNGIEIPPNSRLLFISGQIGTDISGRPVAGFAEQARIVFEKIGFILRDAGMDFTNLVRTTSFLTDPAYYGEFAKLRLAHYGEAVRPTNSLIVVRQLFHPDLLVEIDAIAAAAPAA